MGYGYGSPPTMEDVPQSDSKDALLQTRPSPREAGGRRRADSTKQIQRQTITGLVSPLTATNTPLSQHHDVNDDFLANNAKIALARDRIKRSYDSNLDTEVVLPRFRFDHLTLGKELGTGGFSTVYEVCKINADCVVEKKNARQQTKRPRRKKKRSSRFSIKRLSPRNSNLGHLNRSTHSHDDQELTISRRRRVVIDLPESSSHDGFDESGSDESSRDFDVGQWKHRTREEDILAGDSTKASEPNDSLARNPRREYHNFSFRSWRESEPGQEGNDAIPQAELDGPADFASVKDRKVIMCSSREDGDVGISSMPRRQDKMYIADNVSKDDGNGRYALKIISPRIVEQEFRMYLQAAMDNAKETYFLSVLEHPNIIKLRGVGQGDFFDPRYFLLLDRLENTLQDRIEDSWRVQQENLENNVFVWNRALKLKALNAERLVALKDLAGAVGYLHNSNIIYRDLKPENVGFDCSDCLKLFDFGLCREMKSEDENAGAYKMTPMTGSLRYMAPEIFNGWPYNSLADSYSFGILLWEVIALVRAFESYTSNEIKDMVLKYGERPKIKEDWSARIVGLMTSCWNSSFRKRPSMKAIAEVLQKEIDDQETPGVGTS